MLVKFEWKNKFETEDMTEGFFAILDIENSRGFRSAVEETIPPYPIIPHFSVLQRNEAECSIHFPLISFLNPK
jgi:hypothetical protein